MTPLIFAATCDFAGKVRGKAFPAADLDNRLQKGVGWTPTNVQINCFDINADSPFGALGDLLMIPDPQAAVEVPFGEVTERFMLSDILELDGTPWAFCTRSLLKSALTRLETLGGLRLLAAFEHEFQLKTPSALIGEAYGRNGFEEHRVLCETLMDKLALAGLTPDSIMKEYGRDQIEVVIGPEPGLRAADAAVILRELTRSTARHLGQTATFTPIRDPDSVGNGVHIHMSLQDVDGTPVGYDPDGPQGLSSVSGAFAAGVLKYLDSYLALTAPSVISYLRLTPHRWSAAYNNLGYRDREASLRICPVTAQNPTDIAHQFNLEFRAGDAAASPYLALAAIVQAGCQGIEEALAAPEPTHEDLSQLPADTLAERGLVRLPQTLEAALERFEGNETVCGWFPEGFARLYADHKRSEISHLAGREAREQCAAYEATY